MRLQIILSSLAVIFYNALMVAQPVYAADGNTFLADCKAYVKMEETQLTAAEEQLGAIFCGAYLTGFIESHMIDTDKRIKVKHGDPIYCLPQKGFTVGQLARMVIKYLEDNPDKLHQDAKMAVLGSLIVSFPCQG